MVQSTIHPRNCILSELGVETRNPATPVDERYLLYQPQAELSK